jgi:hypothetical protein
MVQKMIVYQQLYKRDEHPLTYYDPNALYNETAFTLRAGEEVLLIISGTGFRVEDETIYQLELQQQQQQESRFFIDRSSHHHQQLCMLVHNRSPTKTFVVARKTALASVLELPRVKAYFCHVAITQLAQARLISPPPSPYSPSNSPAAAAAAAAAAKNTAFCS